MQLTNGNIYWQKKSKIEKTYPYLTRNKTCDVLVIGGGITGAITAHYLAKEGANVIVVEKNIVGFGSTSIAPAMLDYGLDIDMNRLEKSIGATSAKKIYKLCLDAIDKIEQIDQKFAKDSCFQRQDALYFSNRFMQKASMAKEFETRRKSGFNTVFLNSHNMINLSSAILTKGGSAVMNPYAFTQGLFDHLAKQDSVHIYENTKIEDIKCGYESVECRTNNNFKIKADTVIFTSGFDTLKYLPESPAEVYKTFTIVSQPVPALHNADISFTAKDTSEPYHYLRFTKNGRVIYGGEDIKFSDKLTDRKYLSNVANDRYRRLFNAMQKTLYHIDDIAVEYAFNGTFVNTKDRLPIIDEMPGMPNCFCNLGFGSNGILYSVIGADMLKDAIKGLYTKEMNMFKVHR